MAQTDKKKKKIAVIIVAVVLGFCLVSGLVLLFAEPISKTVIGWFTKDKKDDFVSVIFYDYHYSPEQMERYFNKDRSVYYTYGAETVALTENTLSFFPGETSFFLRFFEVLVEGDPEAYNALFTDAYFQENPVQELLFPQLAYDIHVTFLEKNDVGGKTVSSYEVSYKLMLNNGFLRRDILSDASRPQIMTLETVGNETKISDLRLK